MTLREGDDLTITDISFDDEHFIMTDDDGELHYFVEVDHEEDDDE